MRCTRKKFPDRFGPVLRLCQQAPRKGYKPMQDTHQPTGFTPTQRWVLGLAAAGSFMAVLDAMVVTTALDTLRHDLAASVEALEWTVNAYSLSFATLLMTGAALGDR